MAGIFSTGMDFGMIWPIGQPAGRMHEMALRSRDLWVEVLKPRACPTSRLARCTWSTARTKPPSRASSAKWAQAGLPCEWLNARMCWRAATRSGPRGCSARSGVPRKSPSTRAWRWRSFPGFSPSDSACSSAGVRRSTHRSADLEAGDEKWEVDAAIVCTGHDFETLYPEMFRASGVTRCKLQMMRTRPQPEGWQLGPALAAGLTLRFYESFQVCRTLAALKERIAAETPEYDRWGIHVLVSQTAGGELTIGDSHEYGAAVDPFDRAEIDDLILRYARGFLQAPNARDRAALAWRLRQTSESAVRLALARSQCARGHGHRRIGHDAVVRARRRTVKEMGF
jgi:hypothetical protein